MARNPILQTVIVLICINYIDGQYFDILQALQPYIQTQTPQTFNFYNDFTTRRPKPKRPSSDSRNPDSVRRVASEAEKKRKQTNTPLFETNYFSTTQKAVRKTTKSPNLTSSLIQKSQNRQDSSKTNAKSKSTNDSRNTNSARNNDPDIIYFEDNVKRPSNSRNNPKSDSRETNSRDKPKSTTARAIKKPNQQISNENVWYDANSVTRAPYETTKAYVQSSRGNKNVYTTHNPLLHRPGVKPPVVHGPPITNRPVTQRPEFDLRPDLSLVDANGSPKVITGPDEDLMSAVDRKRYIDIAERMCDKYKALNMKQVHAIPLVPSPEPVRYNVSTCAPTTVPLVVGGRVVTIEEFPHMTLVGWLKSNSRGYAWKCGGSLLSNQYILTAGHCAYQDFAESIIEGPPRVVQLGSSYLNDPKAIVKKISTVIRHPKYKKPEAYYDLAILKMASTVSFSDKVKPACLGVPPQPDRPILATGWGRTEFGESQSEELRSVSLPIWRMDDCYRILGSSRKLPQGPSSESQICAGERRGGKDTCQGDSGGPAQIQDGCSWRVVAVTSVGRSCGEAETPAIYATVQRAFISAIVFGQATQNDNSNNRVETNNRGTTQATNNWNVQASNNRGTQATNIWNSNRDGQAANNNRGTNQGTSNLNIQASNNRVITQVTNNWNSNREIQTANNNRDAQATNNNRGSNQATNNNWNSNRDVQATNNNRGSNQATNNWNVQATNNNRVTTQAPNNWNSNRDSQATNNNRGSNQQATNNNRNDNWNSNNRQTSVTNQQNNFNRQNNDFNTQTAFNLNPSIADSSVIANSQGKRNNWENGEEDAVMGGNEDF
ncbi:uncharacterized protein [Epargyreus clarus]|uniref:uncharacterized protein isoform X2 n=1 Tax=Epargyreus clarus TaxID=520877 RepID=UPI003C2FE391